MLWAVRSLTENRRGISEALANDVYTQPALSPAFPWLDAKPPSRPNVTTSGGASVELIVNWTAGGAEPVWLWVVQGRTGGVWTTDIVAGFQTGRVFLQSRPEVFAVTAIDRCGNSSPPAVFEPRTVVAKPSL
jgi:hypothetical protein